jgi:integrase/recombinase XerD
MRLGIFRSIFAARRTFWGRTISGSTRFICFVIASSPGTIEGHTAALHFLFVKTLRRPYVPDQIPFLKCPKKLPTVLSPEEVARLIDSAPNLMHHTMLMTLYATGLRRAELFHLKVSDIESERMVIHVRQGKGSRDRDVPLTPKLIETLREYWLWMKPRTYLFPGTVKGWRADVPITEKIVWQAVNGSAKGAGITKRVSPHSLRHYAESRTMPNGFVPSWRRFGKISLDAIFLCGTIRHSPVRFTSS